MGKVVGRAETLRLAGVHVPPVEAGAKVQAPVGVERPVFPSTARPPWPVPVAVTVLPGAVTATIRVVAPRTPVHGVQPVGSVLVALRPFGVVRPVGVLRPRDAEVPVGETLAPRPDVPTPVAGGRVPPTRVAHVGRVVAGRVPRPATGVATLAARVRPRRPGARDGLVGEVAVLPDTVAGPAAVRPSSPVGVGAGVAGRRPGEVVATRVMVPRPIHATALVGETPLPARPLPTAAPSDGGALPPFTVLVLFPAAGEVGTPRVAAVRPMVAGLFLGGQGDAKKVPLGPIPPFEVPVRLGLLRPVPPPVVGLPAAPAKTPPVVAPVEVVGAAVGPRRGLLVPATPATVRPTLKLRVSKYF